MWKFMNSIPPSTWIKVTFLLNFSVDNVKKILQKINQIKNQGPFLKFFKDRFL